MRHEKPEVCGDKPFIYEICGKDHHINNYTYNVIIYKNKKEKRCLYDLVKCENYTSMG